MVTEAARPTPDQYQVGYETYLSPFTFRYGSPELRKIWSQNNFWHNVRKVWVAVARVQHEAGLVTDEQLDNLEMHIDDLSVERIFGLEKKSGHDVNAAIAEYSEVAPIGGKILHNGLTSEDVLSNAEVLQIHESLGVVRAKLIGTLAGFAERIDQYKDLTCMGFTHLQAAEPTTMGYRFAKYAQDLLIDLQLLDFIRGLIKGKGIKGPVGTSGSIAELLEDTDMTPKQHEKMVMKDLELGYVLVSDQTYPRKFLLLLESCLANIGQSLHRFALDLQILQSSPIDEVSEPRRKGQVGSSAMPHKHNPINSENIDSLTEELPGMWFSSWMTSSFVTLERTLRDSAGKRSWLPESLVIIDESLARAEKVVRGLTVHENSVETNLRKFAPYCATEIVLAELTKKGMDRKDAHAILVEHAENAIETVRSGKPNPMKDLLLKDKRIVSLIEEERIEKIFNDVLHHVGNAPKRCSDFLVKELYPAIGKKYE